MVVGAHGLVPIGAALLLPLLAGLSLGAPSTGWQLPLVLDVNMLSMMPSQTESLWCTSEVEVVLL